MFKIDAQTGTITFPDGTQLAAPYEPLDKYLEYAAWVQAGNEPEIIGEAA